MMRSLYSAVSGLKTHQTRMDVIGNNIANVNTEAFKSSRVTFSEIMYQTTSQASGGNATLGIGGVNAKQVGLGVATGATSIAITTAGAAETTGNPFDLKLTDSQTTNFFIVSDGTNTFFTRSGSYYVDGNGYLCMTSTGYTLMGWQVDPTTGAIKKDTVTPLQVMSPANQTSAPEATTKAQVSGILDKNDANLKSSEDGYVMTLNFYDDLGYSYTARFSVRPVGSGEGEDAGKYKVSLTDILDQYGESVIDKANRTNNVNDPITADDLFSAQNYDGVRDADGKIIMTPAGEVRTYVDKNGKELEPVKFNFVRDTATGEITTFAQADGNQYYYYEDASGKTVVALLAQGSQIPNDLQDKAKIIGMPADYATMTDEQKKEVQVELEKQAKMLDPKNQTLYYYEGKDSSNNDVNFVSARSMVQHEMVFDTNEGTFVSIGNGNSVMLNMSKVLSNTENAEGERFSNFMDIEIDFSSVLNLNNGGTSTMQSLKGQDGDGAGKKLGALTGLSVDNSGRVYGSYDNGNTILLCQVSVAQFSNASGLEKVGDNCYQTTLNSGDFDGIGVEITADGSSISTGELEMSNVDLSAQFTDMIITQRGFQANSRVITTSDTLLEELINLKR